VYHARTRFTDPSAMRTRLLYLLLFAGAVALPRFALAQELNCSVNVDYSQLSGGDYEFLNDLRPQIREYLNERHWTDDRFREMERIDCSVQVTVEDAPTLTSFRARLVVASRRPIYGSMQNTTVLQMIDNEWQFSFSRGSTLHFDLDRYDPLTSVLDFYAFIILGYDYDTFSELGGTPHFERARRLADRAQAQGASGWSTMGSERGRSQLISQLMDPQMRTLRSAQFAYYFNGLDRFLMDADAARASILGVLETLDGHLQETSRSFAVDLFFGTKAQELAAVFETSPLSSTAYNLLIRLDPARMSEYNRLVE
jgi:hypothetical protein